MFRIISLGIGYLLGCFQTSIVVARLMKGIDIRQYGSGNAGTTNVLRVMGLKAAAITFIGDILKAILAVLIARNMFGENAVLAALYGGCGAIIGHNWPVFFAFRGGKGIASTIGILFAIDFRIGLAAILIMVCIITITRYVSLGSMVMALCIPVLFYVFHGFDVDMILISSIMTFLAIFRHRGNIKRLLEGKESKIGQRTKEKVGER